MGANVAPLPAARVEGRYFYLWMATAFVLVAFGGFAPTYWAPLVGGTFKAPPIIHIHGILMFTWVCFYFSQTALVATGRTLNHRNWGLAGIALFTAILCVILVGEMAVIKQNEARGAGEAARRFAAVTLCAWPLMAGLFATAIARISQPDVHKRVMTLLMIAMLTPAIARVFITLFAPPGAAADGPPPPFVSLPPSLMADLFIVVAMVRDWRTLGRPHPVYVIGGVILVAQQTLTIPFAATDTWMHIVTAFERLAG
jgi:hypothetical protein